MWLGGSPFDPFGYYTCANPCIKGNLENLDPGQCYRVFNLGGSNTHDQFHVIPVAADGHELGPAAFTTAGQVMYSYWNNGATSSDYDISDHFIGG